MEKQRILITVKTYPQLSKTYGETVCTAGITESGQWIRLYPVPFRRLDEKQQYRKYDWVECAVRRRVKDHRPESHSPASEIVPTGRVDTSSNWRERRRLILGTGTVFDRLEPLIQAAHANERSLAVFKPSKILDWIEEEDEREWNRESLEAMRQNALQMDLFDDNSWRQTFEVVNKVPWKFSYRFEDADGRTSTLQLLDWEAGALYWNCLRAHGGDEAVALAKVREKYFDTFTKTDLHFFLGTLARFHSFGPNPWSIVGVFPIPHETQRELF
jgi:hypothetical protein